MLLKLHFKVDGTKWDSVTQTSLGFVLKCDWKDELFTPCKRGSVEVYKYINMTVWLGMTTCRGRGNKVTKEHAAFLFSVEEGTDLENTTCDTGKEQSGPRA